MTFWNWLDENASWIRSQVENETLDHADKITEEFEKDFPDLEWEIEVTDEGPWFFILSANGDLEKFGTVIESFQNAPKLTNWVVLPFKQPGSVDAEVHVGDTVLGYDAIWYRAEIVDMEDHHGLELDLYIEGLTEENSDELIQAAYLLLDNAVGEFDAATRLLSVGVEALNEDPDESEDLFPLAELPEFIEQLTDMELDEDEDDEDDDVEDEEDELDDDLEEEDESAQSK